MHATWRTAATLGCLGTCVLVTLGLGGRATAAESEDDLDTDAGGSSVEGIVWYDLAPHAVKARTDAGDIEIRGR
jgi:hypothetical protein